MIFDLEPVRALCRAAGCAYRENEPMARHTSFKIGGPADLFLTPDGEEQLAALLPAIRERGIPLHIIGRGSNLLVRDEGVRGVVLAVTQKMSAMAVTHDGTQIVCGAGASLESLCRFALGQGLTGLEFAYGIPGSVGGAVYMNAGAYGGEMRDVLTRSRHIDGGGEAGSFAGEALGLSYRRSAYTDGDFCVTGADFQLRRGDPAAIRARMEELKARRREKQPLDYPSAGSTFKRPAGGYASALIDRCGLKGFAVGGAQVSGKHAGFVINRGGATCADVLALIEAVQKIVLERTGFSLEPEVRLL